MWKSYKKQPNTFIQVVGDELESYGYNLRNSPTERKPELVKYLRSQGINWGVVSHATLSYIPFKYVIYAYTEFTKPIPIYVTKCFQLNNVVQYYAGIFDTYEGTNLPIMDDELHGEWAIMGISSTEGTHKNPRFYYLPDLQILHTGDVPHSDYLPLWENLVEFMRKCIPEDILRKSPEALPEPSSPEQITLGCDPEFEIVEVDPYDGNASILNATQFSESTSYASNYLNKWVGIDGSGPQIEIRPDPYQDPVDLVNEIRSVLGSTDFTHSSSHTLSIKGSHYPLGGHIHITGTECSSELISVLDATIGKMLLPLSGKARGSYKVLGAYRTGKFHGGFEYRTPPASYLHTPRLAALVFKAVKEILVKWESKEEFRINKNYGWVTNLKANNILTPKERTELRKLLKACKEYIETCPLGDDTFLTHWGYRSLTLKYLRKVRIVLSKDTFNTKLQAILKEVSTALHAKYKDLLPNTFFIYVFGIAGYRGDKIFVSPFNSSIPPLSIPYPLEAVPADIVFRQKFDLYVGLPLAERAYGITPPMSLDTYFTLFDTLLQSLVFTKEPVRVS